MGGFKTKIDQYCELVTMNVFCKHSRLKQYHGGEACEVNRHRLSVRDNSYLSTKGRKITQVNERRLLIRSALLARGRRRG